VNHIDRRLNQTQESYAAEDLETMKMARRYSAHVFNLFRPYIGRRVLEVGCGIGTMTAPLLDVADSVVGLEPNPNCASLLQEALGAHPRLDLRVCHLEDCDPSDLAAHSFDTVFCLNVLEHIQDDALALRTFADALIDGGNVLIFVPAVQAAYGPLDAELGHFRRYSKHTLAAAFAQAGLSLVTLRYTNPIGLVAWMFNARVTKSTAHSPTQVRVFDTLVAPWALPLERLFAPPIGLSLVAVGRKQL
jgi:2-polyprenyl-3-methyl-5-hydroxy-6-metoxy-1,4-benzoquinol methylase